jgi:hypothetical protein
MGLKASPVVDCLALSVAGPTASPLACAHVSVFVMLCAHGNPRSINPLTNNVGLVILDPLCRHLLLWWVATRVSF